MIDVSSCNKPVVRILNANHDFQSADRTVKQLGQGTFGKVVECVDIKTQRRVAIKIIRNKKRFHHQALVEIKILDNLRKWVCLFSGL